MQRESNLSSRREFLRRSSAALATGACLTRFSGAGRCESADERRGAIACFRREAALAAREILQQGGNALDAAVAALLVEFVIAPSYAGLGGYGGSFVFYQAKTRKVPRSRFDRGRPRNWIWRR